MDNEKLPPVKRLYDLDAAEISLVKKGANRRRFLITKSARGHMPAHKSSLQDKISKTDPGVMAKVEERLKAHYGEAEKSKVAPEGEDAAKIGKDGAEEDSREAGLSSQAHAAVKAVVRILSPFKDELSPLLIHQILDDAGYELAEAKHEDGESSEDEAAEHEGGEDMEEAEKRFQAIPAKVEGDEKDALPIAKEHFRAAAEEGEKAYKAHLAKLGYEKYPPAETAMKSLYKSEDEEDQDEDEGHEDVNKAKKGESVAKSSTSPDLTRLDPKTRASVESVFKSNRDLIKKTGELETMIKDRDAKDRRREIVAKAAQEAMAWNKKEARKGLEGSTEAIDLLKSKGMDVVILTAKDTEAFKAKTKSVYEKWIKEIGPHLVDSAEKIVKAAQ